MNLRWSKSPSHCFVPVYSCILGNLQHISFKEWQQFLAQMFSFCWLVLLVSHESAAWSFWLNFCTVGDIGAILPGGKGLFSINVKDHKVPLFPWHSGLLATWLFSLVGIDFCFYTSFKIIAKTGCHHPKLFPVTLCPKQPIRENVVQVVQTSLLKSASISYSNKWQ